MALPVRDNKLKFYLSAFSYLSYTVIVTYSGYSEPKYFIKGLL